MDSMPVYNILSEVYRHGSDGTLNFFFGESFSVDSQIYYRGLGLRL